MPRTVLVGSLMVIAVAYAVSLAIKDRPQDVAATAETVVARPTPAVYTQPVESSPMLEQEPALTMDALADAAVFARVEHKYRFLIAEVDQEQVQEVRRRLLERESEANLVARNRMDGELGRLLSEEAFAYYQRLKDSDLEQHHLAEYTGGISGVAPLDEGQERLVLDAKLRQKQRYAAIMRDIGLEREALSVEEREYAHEKAAEALAQYREEFLMEVAPSLTPEQYTLLKNYETTEFDHMLSRLQQKINAK